MEFKICIGLTLFTHVIFIILFQILKFYPPKDINYFYGYRTKASMKSKDSWTFANKIAPIIFVRNMIIGLLLQIIVQIIIHNKIDIEISFLLIMIEIVICIVISYLIIERKLKD